VGGVAVRRNSSGGGEGLGGMEVGAEGGGERIRACGRGRVARAHAATVATLQELAGPREQGRGIGAKFRGLPHCRARVRGRGRGRCGVERGLPLGQVLERLQVSVPIDEEGTSVVVPRQRSPVRRNISRRVVAPLDPQSQSHSPSHPHSPSLSQSQSQSQSQAQGQSQSQVHPVRQSQTQSLPAALLSEQVEEARAERLFSPQAIRGPSQGTESFRLLVQEPGPSGSAGASSSSVQERGA